MISGKARGGAFIWTAGKRLLLLLLLFVPLMSTDKAFRLFLPMGSVFERRSGCEWVRLKVISRSTKQRHLGRGPSSPCSPGTPRATPFRTLLPAEIYTGYPT